MEDNGRTGPLGKRVALTRFLKSDWWPLAGIVLIGAGLRLWHIGTLPSGFYHDEAYYALDALGVLQGRFALFFAANNGREGLFMYLMAPMIALLGNTVEAARGTSALVGIATIPAIYLAARALFGRRVGVLSAAILAISFWHLALSRLALRAITLPLFLCVSIALTVTSLAPRSAGLLPAHNQGARGMAVVAGLLTGLTFYTYTSGQMQIVFVPIMLLILWLDNRRSLQSVPRGVWAAWLIGVILAVAPLAFWLTRHADLYFVRAGQVSVFSSVINHGDFWGTLLGNIGAAVGMFIITGDRIWRHNLSLRPVFDSITGPVFLIGVVALITRLVNRSPGPGRAHPAGTSSSLILIAWLLAYMVPTILAEDTPHFLRGIGVLPAACIIAAVGLEAALAWASRRGLLMMAAPIKKWISPPALVALVALGISCGQTYRDYFDDYVTRPIVGYWLESESVALARDIQAGAKLKRTGGLDALYLDTSTMVGERKAVEFLAGASASAWTDISQTAPLPPIATSAEVILEPNRDWSTLRHSLPTSPTLLGFSIGARAQNDLDVNPRDAYLVISMLPQASFKSSPGSHRVRFANGIELLGWEVSAASIPARNATILPASSSVPTQIHLMWHSSGPVPGDIAVFAHWQTVAGLVAQEDKTPTDNLYPPSQWRPDDLVEDTLKIAEDASSVTQIQIGLYQRSDNQRVAVQTDNGNDAGDSVIIWKR